VKNVVVLTTETNNGRPRYDTGCNPARHVGISTVLERLAPPSIAASRESRAIACMLVRTGRRTYHLEAGNSTRKVLGRSFETVVSNHVLEL
jgi:hypothetical protein